MKIIFINKRTDYNNYRPSFLKLILQGSKVSAAGSHFDSTLFEKACDSLWKSKSALHLKRHFLKGFFAANLNSAMTQHKGR